MCKNAVYTHLNGNMQKVTHLSLSVCLSVCLCLCLSLSLRFNGHFPDEPGLAGVF